MHTTLLPNRLTLPSFIKQHQSEDEGTNHTSTSPHKASHNETTQGKVLSPSLSYHPLIVHTASPPSLSSSLPLSSSSSPVSMSLSSLHHRRAVQMVASPRHKRLLSSTTHSLLYVLQHSYSETSYACWRYIIPLLLITCLCLASILICLFSSSSVSGLLLQYLPSSMNTDTRMTIYSIIHDFPSYTALTAVSTPVRHDALLHHYALQSWLTAVEEDTHRMLILMEKERGCLALHSHPKYQSIPCILIPQSCSHTEHHHPLLSCLFNIIDTHTRTPLLCFVDFPVILSPLASDTLASLSQEAHSHHSAQHAILSSSDTLFLLTSHSTEVVLPVPLVESSFVSQQQEYNTHAVWEQLLEAHKHDQVIVQRRQDIELLIYHRDVFHPHQHTFNSQEHQDTDTQSTAASASVNIPEFLWLTDDSYWKEWLLYHVMSRAGDDEGEEVMFIDASTPTKPLIIHPLLSPTQAAGASGASSPPLSPAHIYNEHVALSASTRLSSRLGQIRHAPLVLRGSCPACSIVKNQLSTLITSLFAHTALNNHILLIQAFTKASLPDLFIFLCWAQRTHFHHFLVLTIDPRVGDAVRRNAAFAHVDVLIIDEPHRLDANADVSASTDADHQLIGVSKLHYEVWRHELMLKLLGYGVNVMVSDTRIIPLSAAVLSHLYSATADLQSTAARTHPLTVDPSLFVLSASPTAINYLTTVMECQQQHLESLLVNNKSLAQQLLISTGRFDCLNTVLTEKDTASSHLSYTRLDPHWYVQAPAYFDDMMPQKTGRVPSLIHLTNWKKQDNQHYYETLKLWGMMSIKPGAEEQTTTDEHQCLISTPASNKFVPPSINHQPLLFPIRILTFTRFNSLQRLLTSLSSVDWHYSPFPPAAQIPAIHLSITISVDTPALDTNYVTALKQREKNLLYSQTWCNNITSVFTVNSTQIQQISCRVLDQSNHLGLVGQWLHAWDEHEEEEADTPMLIVLEDDLSVTPVFFHYVLHLLQRYYFHHYDPLLFSISLQAAHTIVGETDTHSYGQLSVSTLLNHYNVSTYYRYQLVGTWGAVLFRQHWLQFQSWLEQQHMSVSSGEADHTPCVPMLLSSQWWSERRQGVWSQWMIRFVYEYGYYSIYSNHGDDRSVIINHRDAGVNFKADKGPSNKPLLEYTAEDVSVLYAAQHDLHHLQLFDYHFMLVAHGDERSLQYRASVVPESEFDQCWIREDWKQQRKTGKPDKSSYPARLKQG